MMFRLPVCPHCGTVYRYRDTVKAIRQRENVCYHCEKRFKARLWPFVALEALVFACACVGFNILLLTRMTTLNLFLLCGATICFVLIFCLLVPFFVRFRKAAGEEKQAAVKSAKRAQNRQPKKEKKS